MNKTIFNRVIYEAEYMLKHKNTIREIAKTNGVSKSTVHKDLQERLKDIDLKLWREVNAILKEHLDVRHLRGGEATKEKYAKIGKKYVKSN